MESSWCGHEECLESLQTYSEAELSTHVSAAHATGEADAAGDGTGSSCCPTTLAMLCVALRLGTFRQVVVFTGAGISTNCGVPDFRSKGGLYEQVRANEELMLRFPILMSEPELIFTRSFLERNLAAQDFASTFARDFVGASPGAVHHFCVALQQQGILRRVYTQNIDSLHSIAGLHQDKLVEVHGSVQGNNLVHFGDPLPGSLPRYLDEDFPRNIPKTASPLVDLVLVLGTSLQVAPFCGLPNLAHPRCTRVLVNKPLAHALSNAWDILDTRTSFARSQQTSEDGGLYGGKASGQTRCCIGKRSIALSPLWLSSRRFKQEQLLLDMDVEQFVETLAIGSGWSTVTSSQICPLGAETNASMVQQQAQ